MPHQCLVQAYGWQVVNIYRIQKLTRQVAQDFFYLQRHSLNLFLLRVHSNSQYPTRYSHQQFGNHLLLCGSYPHHLIKMRKLKFRLTSLFNVIQHVIKLRPKLSKSEDPYYNYQVLRISSPQEISDIIILCLALICTPATPGSQGKNQGEEEEGSWGWQKSPVVGLCFHKCYLEWGSGREKWVRRCLPEASAAPDGSSVLFLHSDARHFYFLFIQKSNSGCINSPLEKSGLERSSPHNAVTSLNLPEPSLPHL